MSGRSVLILGIAVAVATLLLMASALVRGTPSHLEADSLVVPPAAAAAAEAPAPAPDISGIAAHNPFSPLRGRSRPEPSPARIEPEPVPPPPETPPLNMLGSYPGDWPRLTLTGVFKIGGRYGAVITGGDHFTYAGGSRFPRLYLVGDAIGSGISLAAVDEYEAVVRKDNNGLAIRLGVKPPDPPPAK